MEYFNNDFRAVMVAKCRHDPAKGFEYAMTFTPNGIYKSSTCRVAEDSGVRYTSHRKGYRASPRAYKRFVEGYCQMLDARTVAVALEASRARASLLPDPDSHDREGG